MSSPLANHLVNQLVMTKDFFDRSTDVLEEEDSTFVPRPEMMSVAQQVAHVAQTIDWFREGMVSPAGFDMDFAAHIAAVTKITSLKDARNWYQRSNDALIAQIQKMSEAELNQPLPPGPVMGGAPRMTVVGGVEDHTAHHRGVLTVYSRLLGKVPHMPYM